MSHPIIVNLSWKHAIPQFIALAVLFSFIYTLLPNGSKFNAITYGAIVYLLYSAGSRKLIPLHHRRGVKLLHKGEYKRSIEQFQKSMCFFEKHPWIDKYRSIVMLSSSAFTYREMALMNIAYAYSQIEQGSKSEEFYKKVLNEFPENKAAKSALALINSSKDR